MTPLGARTRQGRAWVSSWFLGWKRTGAPAAWPRGQRRSCRRRQALRRRGQTSRTASPAPPRAARRAAALSLLAAGNPVPPASQAPSTTGLAPTPRSSRSAAPPTHPPWDSRTGGRPEQEPGGTRVRARGDSVSSMGRVHRGLRAGGAPVQPGEQKEVAGGVRAIEGCSEFNRIRGGDGDNRGTLWPSGKVSPGLGVLAPQAPPARLGTSGLRPCWRAGGTLKTI